LAHKTRSPLYKKRAASRASISNKRYKVSYLHPRDTIRFPSISSTEATFRCSLWWARNSSSTGRILLIQHPNRLAIPYPNRLFSALSQHRITVSGAGVEPYLPPCGTVRFPSISSTEANFWVLSGGQEIVVQTSAYF